MNRRICLFESQFPRRLGPALCGLASVLLCAKTVGAQQVVDVTTKAEDRKSQSVEFLIPWTAPAATHDFKVRTKVTTKSAVTIRVKNFNFVRYDLRFGVDTQAVAPYLSLEKLWSQVLDIGALSSRRLLDQDNPPPFLTALQEWRTAVDKGRVTLDSIVAKFPKTVYVDRADSASGIEQAKVAKALATELDGKRKTAYDKIIVGSSDNTNAYYAQELYARELQYHTQLVDGLNSFADAATTTANGKTWSMAKRASGTLVTATLTVEAKTTEFADKAKAEKPATIQYFVTGDHPVMFHAGPVIEDLSTTDFEKIRSLNGTDVFREVTGSSPTAGFTAFLSYEVASTADGDGGLYLTLGTGLKKPGEKLYAGGTAKLLGRLFLTGGIVTTQLTVGENLLDASVFESLRKKREWKAFGAVSFSPF